MQMVWGVALAAAPTRYTTSATEHANAPSSLQRGLQFLTFHGRGLDLAGYVRIAQNKDGVLVPWSADSSLTDLGYASRMPTAIATLQVGNNPNLGFVVPVSSTKHAPSKSIVVAGSTTTHTLVSNYAAGGIIDSWTINNATFTNVQMLNRYDSYLRGIQAAASWVDNPLGQFTKHTPMQGGNYWSLPTLSTSFTAPASILLGQEIQQLSPTSTKITTTTCPLDLDPDGGYAMPGLDSYHNGSRYQPAVWHDLRLITTLTLNLRDIENLHQLDVTLVSPREVRTYYFDAELYAAFFLDAAQFAELWAYNPLTAASTQISNGVSGGTYYKDNAYRTYHMGTRQVYENDTGVIGSSFLPGGCGVVGARGALASALAFGVYQYDSEGADTAYNFATVPTGNVVTWAQKRDAASGRDGENFVMLGHGTMFTSRLHSPTRSVLIPAGSTTNTRYLLTDSWTNIVSKVTAARAAKIIP